MGHRPMNRDDIAAQAKGMVPFVREVVTERPRQAHGRQRFTEHCSRRPRDGFAKRV